MTDPAATTPLLWHQVDEYVASRLLAEDEPLRAAVRTSAEGGLPPIQITAAQGQLLQILAKAIGARRVLEIGTLGGYSAIWLARGVGPGGTVLTLERDPHHADVARQNLSRAGVGDRVEIRVGDALGTLPTVEAEHRPPFDLVFIDADRPHYDEYLGWAIRLGHSGTLIVVDNVVKEGAVLDPSPKDPGIAGLRRFTDRLGTEPNLIAVEIQTVGSKGHDGFALALVTGPAP